MKLCDRMFVGEMHLGRRSYRQPLKVSCPQTIYRFHVVIMECSSTDLTTDLFTDQIIGGGRTSSCLTPTLIIDHYY